MLQEPNAKKPRVDSPKTSYQILPLQYGLKKNARNTTDEDVDRLASCIQSFTLDDDDITLPDEDEEDVRQGGW